MTNNDLPTPVLKDNKLYSAYDRTVCTKCAGMSALYTGVTIGGCKVTPIKAADVVEWEECGLGTIRCECGRLEAVLDARRRVQVRPSTAEVKSS